MPRSFQRKILNHNACEGDQLSIDRSQNAVIREIEAVGNLARDEVEVFVSLEWVRRSRQVPRIYRL